MQNEKKHGVLYGERVMQPARRTPPDWDAVRVSLEVAHQGGFRAAAKQLGQSLYVVRRRVDDLERTLGVKLFTRHADKVHVTDDGRKIFAAAGKMDAASGEMLRLREHCKTELSGPVRLAVTEGLGAFWIMPRIMEFKAANPGLILDVCCSMEAADPMRLEADVAIQIARPSTLDLRAVKLGRLHFMFFASCHYLDAFGEPKSIADLAKHRVLIQKHDSWRTLYDELFPGIPVSQIVTLRTNISSMHYWAVINGAGIGALPTYASDLQTPLVPLDLGLREHMDIWLAYRPGARRTARISRLIDWAIDAFSPVRYPWFRDEFIHPREWMKGHQATAPGTTARAVPDCAP